MNTLIIIPTYNEYDNLTNIIPEVLEQSPEIRILVVDDGSPDGTGEVAERYKKETGRVEVIHRKEKLGLGSAYIAGFKYALAQPEIEYIFEMDADFSHKPEMLPKFLEKIKDCDLVLGSRYYNGTISVVNWPLQRLMLSYFASIYTRIITGIKISDPTGGFKCFRRKVLEAIDWDKIGADGYCFQIEVNFKVWKKGFKIDEVPIIFIDRHSGTSKMSRSIVWEAAWMVWKLRFRSIFGKL